MDDSERKAKVCCNEGAELLKQKIYDVAIMKFDKALEMDPNLADAWHNKGLAYRESGNYEEALKCFDKALEINPELYRTLISKGDTLTSQGFLVEATELFFILTEKGVETDRVKKRVEKIQKEPGIEEALKGKALYNDGEMEKALEEFELSLKANPNDRMTLFYKGKALRNLKRYDEAIICFDDIIGRFSLPETYKEKAFCAIEENNCEIAFLAIENYLKFKPCDEEAQQLHTSLQEKLIHKFSNKVSGKLQSVTCKKTSSQQKRENIMKLFCLLSILLFLYLWITKPQRLVTQLNNSDSDVKKNEAIYGLSAQKGDIAFNALIKTLSDSSPGVRASAVNALGVMGDKRAIDPLVEVLKDKNSEVRYITCIALKRLKDTKAVPSLIDTLKNDNTYKVRMIIPEVLASLGDNRAVEIIIYTAKNDPEKVVRVKSIIALASFPGEETFKVLRIFLGDKDREIRSSAARAFGILGSKNGINVLKQRLKKETDEIVAIEIKESLKKLGAEE